MYIISHRKKISEFYNVSQSAISKRLKSIRIKITKENKLLLLKNRRPINYDDVIDIHNRLKTTDDLLNLF